MKSISVQELKAMRDRNQSFFLLDVREPLEIEIADIGGKLIPLSELPGRIHELEKTNPIVVLCHHGMRSSQAQAFLLNNGFTDVLNLEGGIDDWAVSIDPMVPRY